MGYEVVDHYFSGQGVVLVGKRDVQGNPVRLMPVGNVSALSIAVATTVIEHKESMTGQRGIDLRLTTEIKASLSMTLENYIAKNLADALRGDSTIIPAGTAFTDTLVGYLGAVIPFKHINVSNFSLKLGANALTAYVDKNTPYDYIPNLAAGSVKLNDGTVQPFDKLNAKTVTALTVGSPTVITATNTLTVGQQVTLSGFGGVDASLLNGQTFTVVAASGTSFSVAVDSTGKTITATSGTTGFVADGSNLSVTYDYPQQYLIDSLTEPQPELYMRFEGLNTAEGNQPVVVDVFRFATDPLKSLDLITDKVQQFVLDGSVLIDNLQQTGSRYFKVRKLV